VFLREKEIQTLEQIFETQQRSNAFVEGIFVQDQNGAPGLASEAELTSTCPHSMRDPRASQCKGL
jgi:hypothetical protein